MAKRALHERVVELMRAEIEKGEVLKEGRVTTLKALARWARRRLGETPSPATLQRAVAQLKAEQRVDPVRSVGVRIGPPSRWRAPGSTKTLGFCAAEVADLFVAKLLEGCLAACREYNYRLLVTDSRREARLELANFDQLAAHTDGIIMIPIGANVTDPEVLDRRIRRWGRPVVFIERTVPNLHGVERVAVDNARGGEDAANHLIDRLHLKDDARARSTRQLFVVGREKSTGQIERYAGFLTALSTIPGHFALPAVFTLPMGALEFSTPRGQEEIDKATRPIVEAVKAGRAASRRRSRRAKGTKSTDGGPYAGVFCMADAIAIWIWWCLKEKDISVPEEVILVGFDDAFYAEPLGLSTIRQDLVRLGRLAVQRVLDAERPQVVQPELIVRDSTGKVPKEQRGAKAPLQRRPSR